jgi:hypothetical protein
MYSCDQNQNYPLVVNHLIVAEQGTFASHTYLEHVWITGAKISLTNFSL